MNYREREAARKRKHYAEHKAEQRARAKSYYDRNRDKFQLRDQARRLRKLATVNDLTRSQWLARLIEYGYRCAYCGRNDVPMTMDHQVPLSRGGQHTLSNVVPACGDCNRRKYTKTAEEFGVFPCPGPAV